jgi:hypothetical protein
MHDEDSEKQIGVRHVHRTRELLERNNRNLVI